MYEKQSDVDFMLTPWLFRCAFKFAESSARVQAIILSLFDPPQEPAFDSDARTVLADPRVPTPKNVPIDLLVRVMRIANGNGYAYDDNSTAVALYQVPPASCLASCLLCSVSCGVIG